MPPRRPRLEKRTRAKLSTGGGGLAAGQRLSSRGRRPACAAAEKAAKAAAALLKKHIKGVAKANKLLAVTRAKAAKSEKARNKAWDAVRKAERATLATAQANEASFRAQWPYAAYQIGIKRLDT